MAPSKTKRAKVVSKRSGVKKAALRPSSPVKSSRSKKKPVGPEESDPNDLGPWSGYRLEGSGLTSSTVEEMPSGFYPFRCPASDCPSPVVIRAEWLSHVQIYHHVEISEMECPYPGKIYPGIL